MYNEHTPKHQEQLLLPPPMDQLSLDEQVQRLLALVKDLNEKVDALLGVSIEHTAILAHVMVRLTEATASQDETFGAWDDDEPWPSPKDES